MDTNIARPYIKMRKNFGRQTLFCDYPAHLLDSIDPNKVNQKQFGLRNPVHQEAQASLSQSEHYINTKQVYQHNSGVNHAEGGWPKEIPFYDEEATARLRKRVERDDGYIDAVANTYPVLEHYMNQNNGIEMYEMYYKTMPFLEPVEKCSLRVNNVCADPNKRPISCVAWTIEDDPKLVATYCYKQYPVINPLNSNLKCYIWDLENPNAPSMTFQPPTACWQVVCSPVTPSVLIGGLEDGRVCIFDIRAQLEPVMFSPMHLAHRDPVSALLYIQSRINTEFFSGSSDGMCMWWDVRNISNPSDILIMSVNILPGEHKSFANAEGVSALQYDRAFPTRFLCGTETGLVINVNRKGKTHNELMSSVFSAHNSPVKAVYRSPCTTKIFITCGDWTVHIWSDDVLTSPIISGMPHRYQINDVVWSPQRVSSYMSVSADGKFRYWDLLRKYREPVITLQVSKYPLLKIKPHEEGRLVAVGDIKGVLYVLSLSENIVESGPMDKSLMMQSYDRETKREHILELRVKEIRLKIKNEEEGEVPVAEEVEDEEALVKAAEDEYKRVVIEENQRSGNTTQASFKGSEMRKR